MDLRDYLRVLRQRWLVIVLVTGTISSIGAIFALQEQTRYVASAEIILRDNPYRYFRSGEYPSFFPDHFSRATRAQLIRSREVLTHAIRTELSDDYRTAQGSTDLEEERTKALEDAVSDLRAHLSISQDEESEIITISYEAIDRDRAKRVVNGVATAFHAISKIRQERGIDDAIQFIHGTNKARSEAVSEARRELARVKREKKNVPWSKDQDKFKGLLDELQSLRESAREMRLERNRLDIQINTLSALVNGDQPVPLGDEKFSQKSKIESEIETKEFELLDLQRRYTEEWPGISQIRNDINFLNGRLELLQEKEQVTARLELKDELGNLELRKKQLQIQLGLNVDAQKDKAREKADFDVSLMSALLKIENEEQELEARVKVLDESIRSLENYAQKLRINKRMIVEAVYLPEPVKQAQEITKKGFRTFPLIFLTALIVGIAFAYLLEYINTSIRTEHDVKRYVNLPLFGMVMKIREEADRLLLHSPPKSPVSELFNTIAAMIEAQSRESGTKTFMIASPNAAEGKSTITTNIAIALARGGARVTLVDADLRRAVLHKFFNVNNREGLSTYLENPDSGNSDFTSLVHKTEIENLKVLPAGPHPANPVLLLKSGAFRSLLDNLEENADFILIDVPPVRIAVDTILLAPQVQNTILLTSAGETNKEDVAFAKNLIESAKGNLIGCILNKAVSRGEGYYYYYDYYRYYGSH